MLRSRSQTVGRTAKAVITAKSVCESSSNAPKFKRAFGNNEDKLSPSKIIYSMQQAWMKEHSNMQSNCYKFTEIITGIQ